MNFKSWFFQEDTTVVGNASYDPTDNGLHRPQKHKKQSKFSKLATQLFLTKDPEKLKRFEIENL